MDKGNNSNFKDQYKQYITFYKGDNKDKYNKAFKALVLDITTNNDLKDQDSNYFLTTFKTLSTNKVTSISIKLANKAYTYLFIVSIDIIGPTIITNPFAYSIIVKSRYTSIVFIGIIINISIFKKSTAGYRQFQAL